MRKMFKWIWVSLKPHLLHLLYSTFLIPLSHNLHICMSKLITYQTGVWWGKINSSFILSWELVTPVSLIWGKCVFWEFQGKRTLLHTHGDSRRINAAHQKNGREGSCNKNSLACATCGTAQGHVFTRKTLKLLCNRRAGGETGINTLLLIHR